MPSKRVCVITASGRRVCGKPTTKASGAPRRPARRETQGEAVVQMMYLENDLARAGFAVIPAPAAKDYSKLQQVLVPLNNGDTAVLSHDGETSAYSVFRLPPGGGRPTRVTEGIVKFADAKKAFLAITRA